MYRTHSRQPDTGTARISGSPANRLFPHDLRVLRTAPYRLILLAAALFAGQPLIAQADDITWGTYPLAPNPIPGVSGQAFFPHDPGPPPSPSSWSGNTVTVPDTAPPLNGNVYGGIALTAPSAFDNMVIITGTVTGDIFGGYSVNGNATGNTVTISGGTVNGTVSGGYASIDDSASIATATNNTVSIYGTPHFNSTSSSLFGGMTLSVMGSSVDGFTGNTLNFSAEPVTVAMVGGFQHYNFTLDYANRTTPLIHAGGGISLGSSGVPSVIQVTGVRPSGQVLQVNDTFVLMHITGTMSIVGSGTWTNSFQQGSRIYDVETRVAGGQIIASITGIHNDNAPVAAIPTLSEWGMILTASLLALFAFPAMRRRG